MALAEVLRLPEPEIKEFGPLEIDMKLAVKMGLDELIPLGYNYQESGIKAGVRALSEFDEEPERSAIYLAMIGDKAIASLTTTRWIPEDEYGKKFWGDLKQRNRNLHRRLVKVSPLGINIAGITTHPEYRRRGLTEKLYKHILESVKPSFITGITKTPEAVIARANILRRLGEFRTFYGNDEVTPDRPSDYTNIHQDLLDADIRARWEKLEETLDGSDVYLINGWLPTTIPDVSSFPSYIQKSFEQVISEQNKANLRAKLQEEAGFKAERKVAIKALISVTPKVRLRSPDGDEDREEVESGLEQLPLFNL